MNESEKKDKILTYLNLEGNRTAFFQLNDLNSLVFEKGAVSFTEMRYLVECMVKDDYILDKDPVYKYKYTITLFLESGGYTGKEDRIKSEAEERRKQEVASYQKTLNEGKLAKWQVKIFWPAFVFTVIGSALGIASFIMQLAK